MGGFEATEWFDALDASFEAGLAREEEVAAADLAFSLRQDVDLREALLRSRSGWALVVPDAGAVRVDEAGLDYVRAGDVVVPADRMILRADAGDPPATSDRRLGEVLGAACRSGRYAELRSAGGRVRGHLVRMARDHVAVRNGDVETIVGLAGLEAVRLAGYSASRGFSG